MALSTYTELKAAIADWLERTDLTSQIVDFITLAEAEFNRTLLVPEREDAVTSVISGATVTLPTDFHALRSIYIDADPKVFLQQMSLAELRTTYSANATGKPQNFALQSGNELVLAPSPDASYSLILNYYKTIPALSGSVATNWLLTSHPDIYLFASLLQAGDFLADDPRIPLWRNKLDRASDELRRQGYFKAHGGAPQRIRPPYSV